MKQQISFLIAMAVCLQVFSQNVGIGTNNPSRAKLEVHGAVGATSAIFGGEGTGISLQRNWPSIGFNQYYNNGSKYIGNGFAGVQYLDPGTGNFSMDLFSNGNTDGSCYGTKRIFTFTPSGIGLIGSNYYNANLAVSRGASQDATACFFGDTYHSYFNQGSEQNTYIRAGKVNGKVYINDIPGSNIIMSGHVGINTATPGVPLEVYQEGLNGLSLVSPGTYNSWQFAVGNLSELLYVGHRYSWVGYFNATDGSYNTYSDARLKQNVQALPGIMNKVMSLKPVEYEMIKNNPTHKTSLGFIAQDVRKIFPELVTVATDTTRGYENIDSVHSLNYTAFAVVAIKAIQEQQQAISDLKATVLGQLQKNKELINRVSTLEAGAANKQQER